MSKPQNRRRFLKKACAGSVAAVAAEMMQRGASAAESDAGKSEPVVSGKKPNPQKGIVDYREHDRRIWEEELEEFVPQRVFDTHCHLANREHVPADSSSLKYLTTVTLKTLQQWQAQVFPGRRFHVLALAKPSIGVDPATHNRFLGEQIAQDRHSRVNCLAVPTYPVDRLAKDIKDYGFNGLKVYRFYSTSGDAANCRIHEFLSHEHMELANEKGLWVTLHLSRSDGCADEYNLKDLEEYTTRRYPRIKWILAHCARSFTYYPMEKAIDRLCDMPNIWYDLSAVTTEMPFVTLFQKEKLERVFYGTDGVDAVSFHGKYVTLGRAWQTFRADEIDMKFPHCEHRPILAIYEQLLAIKHAAKIAGFSKSDIEDIFWRNASRALKIDKSAWA